jgi:hypothetical protein
MPAHDWTRVDDGVFHAFHTVWLTAINHALNGGILPSGYYSLPEQHVGRFVTDVLTLHSPPSFAAPAASSPQPGASSATLLAEAPPQVRWRQTIPAEALSRRRSLAIRHVSGHRLVALLEIVSPANKDRPEHVEEFAAKVESAIDQGVHVLFLDLFAPGKHDPGGMHGAVLSRLHPSATPPTAPSNEPLAFVSYAAGPTVETHIERAAFGAELPTMPLFLTPEKFINVPLEATYRAAYGDTPPFWRELLESPMPL